MREIQTYIEGQKLEGKSVEQGSFTISPQGARRKLVDSVPPAQRTALAAAGLLFSYFYLHGLKTPGTALWKYANPIHVGPEGVAVQLIFIAGQSDWHPETVTREIQETLDAPLQSQAPTALCLSRALLILEHLGLGLAITSRFLGLPSFYISPSVPVLDKLKRLLALGVTTPTLLHRRIVVVTLSHSQDWPKAGISRTEENRFNAGPFMVPFSPSHELLQFQDLAQNGKSRFWSRPNSWTLAPSQVVMKNHDNPTRKDSLRDKVPAKVSLLEYMVGSETPTPLEVHQRIAASSNQPGLLKPLGELATQKRGFIRRPAVILREWSEVNFGETNYLRAFFTVFLREQEPRIYLFSWGKTLDFLTAPDLPNGLVGFVYWPELKQSLYGDSWVKDEQFEAAVEWSLAQARHAAWRLREESDYLWSTLKLHYVPLVYRNEVKKRLFRSLGVEES